MRLNRLAHRQNNPIPKAIRPAIVPVALSKAAGNRPRNPAPVRMVRRLRPTRAARNPTSEVKVRPAIKPAINRRPKKPTGSAAKQEPGQGSNGEKKPGGDAGGAKQQASDSTGGEKQEKPSDGGQAQAVNRAKALRREGRAIQRPAALKALQTLITLRQKTQDAMADEINKDYAQTD